MLESEYLFGDRSGDVDSPLSRGYLRVEKALESGLIVGLTAETNGASMRCMVSYSIVSYSKL